MSAAAENRRALVLVNPHARRGSEAIDPVIRRLEDHGIATHIEKFDDCDELVADIERRHERFDMAVVCGGDGTMNTAARASLKTGLPLGIIPMGTANDLARTLHIPEDLEAAADVIANGHTRTIDVGLVNDLPFFNVASIGLAAQLSDKLSPDIKRKWGRLSYVITAFQLITTIRPFRAEIISEGSSTPVRSLQIAVGNGRYYGGGTVVEAHAAIDDGTLDLYSLETREIWKLFLMFHAFRHGTHGTWREVRTQKGQDFEIRTRKPLPVNVDGDLVAQTPARFTILPKAIPVFVPQSD